MLEQAFRITGGIPGCQQDLKIWGDSNWPRWMASMPCTFLYFLHRIQLLQDSIHKWPRPILLPGRDVEPNKYPNHERQRAIRCSVKDESSFGISNPGEEACNHCLTWVVAPSPGDCRRRAPHGTQKPITLTYRLPAVPLCIQHFQSSRTYLHVVSLSDSSPKMRCDSDTLRGKRNNTSLNELFRGLNEMKINSALRLVSKM